MSQRIAFFLAAGLTGFLLVVVGAAIELGGRPALAAQPTLDPALAEQLATREAAYQALIAQANTELNPTATPEPTPQPTPYPISPQAAAAIAIAANWASQLVREPVLVDFQGTVAYEVALNRGLVYVDATTGRILYNGAAQTVIVNNPPPRSGESESEHDD